MAKNIILTSMSTIPEHAGLPAYYYYNGKNGKTYCWGISQLEAGTKHFLSSVEGIDTILVVGSDATINKDTDKLDNQAKLNQYAEERIYADINDVSITIQKSSAYDFYKYRLAQFINNQDKEYEIYRQAAKIQKLGLKKNKDLVPEEYLKNCQPVKAMTVPKSNRGVKISFVPLQIDGIDNIKGVVDKIRSFGSNEEDEINLYVDVQGGQRTDSSVRNAVMSILTHGSLRNINIKEVVGINYNGKLERDEPYPAHEIVDETSRYQINDLVAGMNAFLQYGKADLIQAYCNEQNIEDENITKLVGIMQAIDDALSLCDVVRLRDNIADLRDFFDDKSNVQDTEEINTYPVFAIMQDEIKRGYGSLINKNDQDTIELVKWAYDNKFYQQAITIIEALMPGDIVKNGILYYADSDERLRSFIKERIFLLYELSSSSNKQFKKPPFPKYEFDDINHLFIKHIKDVCFFMKEENNKKNTESSKQQSDSYENDEAENEYMLTAQRNMEPFESSITKESPYIHIDCGESFIKNLILDYYYVSAIRNSNNHASMISNHLDIKETKSLIEDFIDDYMKAKHNVAENKSKPFTFSYHFEDGTIRETPSLLLCSKTYGKILDGVFDWLDNSNYLVADADEISRLGNIALMYLLEDLKDLHKTVKLIEIDKHGDIQLSFRTLHPVFDLFIKRKIIGDRPESYYFTRAKTAHTPVAAKLIGDMHNLEVWYKLLWLSEEPNIKNADHTKWFEVLDEHIKLISEQNAKKELGENDVQNLKDENDQQKEGDASQKVDENEESYHNKEAEILVVVANIKPENVVRLIGKTFMDKVKCVKDICVENAIKNDDEDKPERIEYVGNAFDEAIVDRQEATIFVDDELMANAPDLYSHIKETVNQNNYTIIHAININGAWEIKTDEESRYCTAS